MSEDKIWEKRKLEDCLYTDFVKEAQAAYVMSGNPALGRMLAKKQGEYTVEDYFALPDTCWVELIDGIMYNMTAPTNIHQILVFQIAVQLNGWIERKNGRCIVMVSPMNVQLDKDNKTMVQPDVYVVCNRDKMRERVLYGEPDLVIEVLSPFSRKRDQVIKFNKYKNAGVREYWIVDPEKQRVSVYDFEHDAEPDIYTFEDKVPVHIFDGELEIDFADIFQRLKFLYDNTTESDR